MFGWTLLLVCLATPLALEVRQEQIFQSWDRMRANLRTLVVDYTWERHDRVFDTREKGTGHLKTLRRQDGQLAVALKTRREDKNETGRWQEVLLVGPILYVLRAEERTAMRIDLTKKS